MCYLHTTVTDDIQNNIHQPDKLDLHNSGRTVDIRCRTDYTNIREEVSKRLIQILTADWNLPIFLLFLTTFNIHFSNNF
jgi:hypothetical protein